MHYPGSLMRWKFFFYWQVKLCSNVKYVGKLQSFLPMFLVTLSLFHIVIKKISHVRRDRLQVWSNTEGNLGKWKRWMFFATFRAFSQLWFIHSPFNNVKCIKNVFHACSDSCNIHELASNLSFREYTFFLECETVTFWLSTWIVQVDIMVVFPLLVYNFYLDQLYLHIWKN